MDIERIKTMFSGDSEMKDLAMKIFYSKGPFTYVWSYSHRESKEEKYIVFLNHVKLYERRWKGFKTKKDSKNS